MSKIFHPPLSSLVLFKNHAGIVATKAKGVAQCGLYFPLLSFAKGEVKAWVDVRVIGKVVDGWRHDIVLHGHNTGNGFNDAGGTQGVTGH